jgi:hypothetical protein
MIFQPEDMKYVIPALTPFISAIIETFVKPKLESIKKHFQGERELLSDPFLTQFEGYLTRIADKCSYMTTLVFQNQQKKLEDLYIPLTLTPRGSKGKILIDTYNPEFIPKHRKVLIVDTGGMGKSTISKFLLLSCIKEQKGIPVFIELRRLKADTPILDYICNEIAPIDGDINKDLILSLIERGDFVFFFDGYDEVPSTEMEGVTTNLQNFINKAGNNSFLLTSRPDDAVVALNDFQAFSINPLDEEEAFLLFKLYDPQGEISERLIETLQRPAYTHVNQFLGNPLLASLLYISFEYEADIPLKKHLFFAQVYEALFRRHDLSKGDSYIRDKQCNLDIDDFYKVLRALAFFSLQENQLEYDRDALLSNLRQVKQRLPEIVFKENLFLDDLIKAVPLFTKDGFYYKWTHKSLREYFAAQYICQDTKGKQEKILRLLCEQGSSLFGTLELCADIDYKTFRKTLVYDFLRDFCIYYKSSYRNFAGKGISADDLNTRKTVSFISRLINYDEILLPPSTSPHVHLHGFLKGEYLILQYRWLCLVANKYNVIYEILTGKQEGIFDEIYMDDFAITKLDTLIDAISASPSGNPICLDEDPESIWNSETLFDIHAFLYNASLQGVPLEVLDFNRCKELKERLEQEAQIPSFEEEILEKGFL